MVRKFDYWKADRWVWPYVGVVKTGYGKCLFFMAGPFRAEIHSIGVG